MLKALDKLTSSQGAIFTIPTNMEWNIGRKVLDFPTKLFFFIEACHDFI